MANDVKMVVKGLPEFQRTLRQYVQYSKRDVPTIVNTKGYYIARAAVWFTEKSKPSAIGRWFSKGSQAVIGKIINKARGKRGEKGLYGESMHDAQMMVRAGRLRHIAFLKSGWIPAIKSLERLAERPGKAKPRDKKAELIANPKGGATPASGGLISARAIIFNSAEARKGTTKDPLGTIGLKGLEKAVAFETTSTLGYIARKLKESARRAGIKVT